MQRIKIYEYLDEGTENLDSIKCRFENEYQAIGVDTVRSLAPICSITTSTQFSEPCLKQTHTATERLIKQKYHNVEFLGTH